MAFNSLFAWFIGKRMSRINYYRDEPIESQKAILNFLNYNLLKTKYFKFFSENLEKECTSLDDLPLQNYDSIKPWINRSLDGEENVLWPGKTNWFAKSSGTSGNNKKLIPVTQDSLENNHYANGKDLLAQYYFNLPNRKLFNAKHLIIGGTGKIDHNNGVFIGDLSAIIIEHLPWWTEWRRTPAKEIVLHGNWDQKLDQMAKAVLHENICIIAGMPSWTCVFLEKVLQSSNKKNIKEIWSNLELYIHGGMNIGPYKQKLVSLFGGDNVNFIESYNASEGYFGMQDKLNFDELLLMTNSNVYFEFIPLNDFKENESKSVISLSQIETNTDYAIVISTSAGLWRYIIGDVVRFTSTRPYRFQLTGRTTNYLNAFGEKLIEIHVEKTVQKVCEITNSTISNYTVAPKYFEKNAVGCHEWLIEFYKEPLNFEEFEYLIDITLQELNDDYKIKRFNNLNIGKPKFVYLKHNAFHNWLKKNNKLGGQHKIPRLFNTRLILEQILDSNQ